MGEGPLERHCHHYTEAQRREKIIDNKLRQPGGIPLEEARILAAESRYNQDELVHHSREMQKLGLSEAQIEELTRPEPDRHSS